MSSGAIMPALAPASIDMLHTVMRPSIDSARMAEPRYSTMWPMPPPVPMRPMMARMMSLAVTPAGSVAVDGDRRASSAVCWGSVCVASTCSTSLVPMPNAERAERAVGRRCGCRRTRSSCPAASAPARARSRARCPGRHRPSGRVRDAELGGVGPQGLDLLAADRDRRSVGRCRSVGTLWSSVATVRSGRRTPRPVMRRPSKACGDVTSWTRWRSM